MSWCHHPTCRHRHTSTSFCTTSDTSCESGLSIESSLGWVATKFGNRKSPNQLSSWHWKKACDGLRNVKVEPAILKDPIKMAKNAWLWMKGSQKKLWKFINCKPVQERSSSALPQKTGPRRSLICETTNSECSKDPISSTSDPTLLQISWEHGTRCQMRRLAPVSQVFN